MSFWEVLWLFLVSFAFIAYLLLLFYIIGDLFRDKETSGWVKAVWIVFPTPNSCWPTAPSPRRNSSS